MARPVGPRIHVQDRDLRVALDSLPQSIRRRALIPGIRKYLRVAAREARRTNLGFRDRSGRLRRSIRALTPKAGRKSPYVSGSLSSTVPYAGVVEFGRSGQSRDTSYLREAFDRTEPQGYRIMDQAVAAWLRNPD